MAHALRVTTRHAGVTARRDRWWLSPALVFLVLSAFVVHSTWAALQGEHNRYGPYLAPFYSPELLGSPQAKTCWSSPAIG